MLPPRSNAILNQPKRSEISEHPALCNRLPQKVQYEPAEQEENDDSRPENPLILLCPPLHHAYRISADAERIRHTVQPPLRSLKHVSLMPQITQHGAPPVQKFIQLL